MKVSKEFILEAHKDACSTWKNKIEKEFPELFVEEKANGWYKLRQSYGFWFGFYEDNLLKYTITDDGFSLIHKECEYENEEKATKEEVETALIAEAKKKGFEEGVEFIDKDGEKQICKSKIKICDSTRKNSFGLQFGNGNGLIFYNGIWATIIEKPKFTKEEAEKKFNIKIV